MVDEEPGLARRVLLVEPELAGRYAIRSIPTLMVLRDGEPVAAQAGLIPAEALVEALDRLAAAGTETAGAREAA